MPLIEEMDLTGRDPDSVEKQGLTPGWYLVMCDKVRKDDKSGALLFRFLVKAGDHEGQDITERLWPAKGDDPEKARKARERRLLFAKRLGLVPEEAWGANARWDWDHAVGRVVAIQVKERKYKDDAGNEHVTTQLDFAGIYPVTDPHVPEEIRKLAEGVEPGGPVNDPFKSIPI
jgi:hypothetical protein